MKIKIKRPKVRLPLPKKASRPITPKNIYNRAKEKQKWKQSIKEALWQQY